MPVGAALGQDHHANHTTRAAIPLDCLGQGALDKVDGVVLLHVFAPVGVAVAVYVAGPGACDGVCLLVEGASEGDAVDLSAVALVPAGDDDAGAEGGGSSQYVIHGYEQ